MRFAHWPSRGVLICCLSLATACISQPPPGITTTAPVQSVAAIRAAAQAQQSLIPPAVPVPVTLVAPGDEVDLRYLDRPELNQSLRVRSDGRIALPMLGDLEVAGRTPDEMEVAVDVLYRKLATRLAEAPIESRVYLIHAGDEIEVRFLNRPEMNETITVRPDGRITLPLVNTLIAQGKSPETLTEELRARYASHIHGSELTVLMRTMNSSQYRVGDIDVRSDFHAYRPIVTFRSAQPLQVFVGGEVARPGVIAYRRDLTLLQAIYEAGGNRPTAAMGSVLVLRKSDGSLPLSIRRDLRADLNSSGTNDILLAPSDVVVLLKTASASLAQSLEQSLFNILPPLKNSAFSFIYNTTPNTTTTIETLP